MKKIFHPANERGHANHGWLNAYHSFSFASWHDDTKVHFGLLRVLNDDNVRAVCPNEQIAIGCGCQLARAVDCRDALNGETARNPKLRRG